MTRIEVGWGTETLLGVLVVTIRAGRGGDDEGVEEVYIRGVVVLLLALALEAVLVVVVGTVLVVMAAVFLKAVWVVLAVFLGVVGAIMAAEFLVIVLHLHCMHTR